MAKKKQRIVLEGLTFGISKLIIEQDALLDDAPTFQDGIRQVIGQVMTTPAQLLASEEFHNSVQAGGANPTVNPLPPPVPRKRRRRAGVGHTKTATAESESANLAGVGAVMDGVPALVLELKQAGFFQQERKIRQVHEKLHEAGHTSASRQSIGMALLELTREKDLAKKLYRHKIDKNWLYRDTPYDPA